MSRAEYMRAYRAKHRTKPIIENVDALYRDFADKATNWDEIVRAVITGEPYNYAKRIAELEAEVKHLEAELAERPYKPEIVPPDLLDEILTGRPRPGRFNSYPFTPAPKK